VSITPDDVEAATWLWLSSFERGDLDGLAAIEAGAAGFGYRTANARRFDVPGAFEVYRSPRAAEAGRRPLADRAVGARHRGAREIGFAWGKYLEVFEHRGGPPERATVRFLHTLAKTAGDWRMLVFHRDVQRFAAGGRYPREITTA
jgi:hypothetical protein